MQGVGNCLSPPGVANRKSVKKTWKFTRVYLGGGGGEGRSYTRNWTELENEAVFFQLMSSVPWGGFVSLISEYLGVGNTTPSKKRTANPRRCSREVGGGGGW